MVRLPWWDKCMWMDVYTNALKQDASKLYQILTVLRLEAIEQQSREMTRLKTEVEIEADRLLERMART